MVHIVVSHFVVLFSYRNTTTMNNANALWYANALWWVNFRAEFSSHENHENILPWKLPTIRYQQYIHMHCTLTYKNTDSLARRAYQSVACWWKANSMNTFIITYFHLITSSGTLPPRIIERRKWATNNWVQNTTPVLRGTSRSSDYTMVAGGSMSFWTISSIAAGCQKP